MKVPNRHGRFAALLSAALAVGGALTLLLTGCGSDHGVTAEAKEEQLYTCGMHPQVIQNKPGNCPICGMKLTPVRKLPNETQASNPATTVGSAALPVDLSTIHKMDIRTWLVRRAPVRRVIRTVGAFVFD